MTQNCQIWGEEYPATVSPIAGYGIQVEGSERTTVPYFVVRDGADLALSRLSHRESAQLTTWLIDQTLQGQEFPAITRTVLSRISSNEPLPEGARADRLLRHIADQSPTVGSDFSLNTISPAVLAWSESVEDSEVGFLIHDLMKRGYLDANELQAGRHYGTFKVPKNVRVTVDGYERIRQQVVNEGASQAFVAMWLDDSIIPMYEEAIKPAIEEAGYNPMLISQKEHVNKIEDEIIAEIRRSRFVVADFSHNPDEGVRGSVYYEAGFAHGLGLDVIFTCKQGQVEDLHFDTSHYSHITWRTANDLREQLVRRILAVVGQGPKSTKGS